MDKSTLINGNKYRQAPQRLLERILGYDCEVTNEGCWLWPKVSHDGYGRVHYAADGHNWTIYVHRLVYMHVNGDPGDMTELDHGCHNPETCPALKPSDCMHRRCYNPDHLKPVSQAENARRSRSDAGVNSRKTHCDQGHEFTPENTYIRASGFRNCRECHRLEAAARRAARKSGRCCQICGADISHRRGPARYCEQCNPPTWRGSAERTAAKRAAGRACQDCGADITDRIGTAIYCEQCNTPRWRGRTRRPKQPKSLPVMPGGSPHA